MRLARIVYSTSRSTPLGQGQPKRSGAQGDVEPGADATGGGAGAAHVWETIPSLAQFGDGAWLMPAVMCNGQTPAVVRRGRVAPCSMRITDRDRVVSGSPPADPERRFSAGFSDKSRQRPGFQRPIGIWFVYTFMIDLESTSEIQVTE